MKNLLKACLLLIVFAVAGLSTLSAQNYTTAVGLRAGYGIGLSGKMFLSETGAVEVGARFGSGYTGIFGVYELHNDIESVDGLQWYWGGGVNVGLYSVLNSTEVSMGIMGALGLDYKFADLPINVAIDWLPVFGFSGYGFGAYNGGLAVRYTLN